MNRRGFLGAILASMAAPAIVRAGVLMPIKPVDGYFVGGIFVPDQKISLEVGNEHWIGADNYGNPIIEYSPVALGGNEMWNFGRDVTDWVNREIKRPIAKGSRKVIRIPPDGYVDYSRLRA